MPCWKTLEINLRTMCEFLLPWLPSLRILKLRLRIRHRPIRHRLIKRSRRINNSPRLSFRRIQTTIMCTRTTTRTRIHRSLRRPRRATVLHLPKSQQRTKTRTNSWQPCAPKPWPKHHRISLNARRPMRESRRRRVTCRRRTALPPWDKRVPRCG